MSRPFKHPKTGIYWFRKRVPADLVDAVGKTEISESLATRDPAEAKAMFAERLAEFERRWANLRAGRRTLTERDAHGIAAHYYKNWLMLHRDNPSLELLWHPQYYSLIWTHVRPERK